MSALLFALYTILSGAQQGIITWLFREYVPESRKDWVHAALHYGGVLIYLVLVAYVAYTLTPSLIGIGVLLIEAALIRALLFDPALNTSRSWFNYREGRPWGSAFEVGTTAIGDKLIRAGARWAHMEPEGLRFMLWMMCLVLAVAAYFFF
jgi:hypothetical protein